MEHGAWNGRQLSVVCGQRRRWRACYSLYPLPKGRGLTAQMIKNPSWCALQGRGVTGIVAGILLEYNPSVNGPADCIN